MTFRPEEFRVLYRDFPAFMGWILDKSINLLFFPREIFAEKEIYKMDLTSKAYVFMKRLNTDYPTFMQMDEEVREQLFRMEMDAIEKENREAEQNGKSK
jgi:hypothetical protein